MTKSILIKVAIFASGAAVGFLVAKKVYEEYYASLAQEEIDSVKDVFTRYAEKDVKITEEVAKNYQEKNGMTEEEYEQAVEDKRLNRSVVTRSSLDGNMSERAKLNYHLAGAHTEGDKVVPNEPDDEDSEDEHHNVFTDAAGKTEEEMDLTKIDRTLPYIIDSDEFTNEFDHHDKISLYYYRVDDILCEESEEVVEDVEAVIGYDALAALDMQTTVWVRNEPLCIDYEVISINKSYAEQIHGLGVSDTALSPREKYLRQQKRRDFREE